MTKGELAERLAQTLHDLDALEQERAEVMETFKQRKTILNADLRSFCQDVEQMRLDEQEAA